MTDTPDAPAIETGDTIYTGLATPELELLARLAGRRAATRDVLTGGEPPAPLELSDEELTQAIVSIEDLGRLRRLAGDGRRGLERLAAFGRILERGGLDLENVADDEGPTRPGPFTLGDAIGAVRDELTYAAVDGDYEDRRHAERLRALAETLERLHRIDRENAPDPTPSRITEIVGRAGAVVDAVERSGLESDHFVGRWDELRAPLEALAAVLDR